MLIVPIIILAVRIIALGRIAIILVYTGAVPPNIPQVRRKAHARNSLLPLITVLQCFQERNAGEVSDTFNRIYRVLTDT